MLNIRRNLRLAAAAVQRSARKMRPALPAAFLAAMLPLGSASADTVFLGAFDNGTVPSSRNSGDKGSGTVSLLGVWMEATASGATRFEVTLPEYVQATAAPMASVWGKYNTRNRYPFIYGSGGAIRLRSEVDYICGVYGFDVDPTNGDLYLVAGRTGSDPGTNDCHPGSNRYLAKYNPDSGKFVWIGHLNRMKMLEFLPDGTLLGIAGNSGLAGRGSIYEIDKSSGSVTYRANPSVGNYMRDLVYNPGDERLYAIEDCNIIRIDTSDWTYTTSYLNTLCNVYRVTASLLTDNEFLVHTENGYYKLVVDPADGSSVSYTLHSSAPGTWPWFPLIASNTDAAGVSKSCKLESASVVTCSIGNIDTRAAVAIEIPVTFDIPATAKQGMREGAIRWLTDDSVVSTRDLNLRILAPDVAVSVTPDSGNYSVGASFALTVDATAVGGKDVDEVSLEVEIPSTLKVNSVSGPGTCGLSRNGARCTGFGISRDDTETMTVNVQATANGYAPVKVSSKVAAGDVDPTNDSDTALYAIGDSVDLVATGTEGGEGKVGAAMNLTVSVTNKGPDLAENAGLVFPGNAGFDLSGATTDTGSCSVSGVNLVCAFGDMAADTTATVSLKVTPNRSGNLTLGAKATSDTLDVAPTNNTYSFGVSVPTLPVVAALGPAAPTSTDSDIRPVLQVAVTPAANSTEGVRIFGVDGTLSVKSDGLGLRDRVHVYNDLDANGVIDVSDVYVGEGSLSAADGNFSVTFAGAITVPPTKTSHFLVAVQTGSSASVASVGPLGPISGNGIAAGVMIAVPFAFAGFLLTGRRTRAAMLGLALSLGACGEVADLFSTTRVTASVTAIHASLMEDPNSSVSVGGLPITGTAVTLKR